MEEFLHLVSVRAYRCLCVLQQVTTTKKRATYENPPFLGLRTSVSPLIIPVLCSLVVHALPPLLPHSHFFLFPPAVMSLRACRSSHKACSKWL